MMKMDERFREAEPLAELSEGRGSVDAPMTLPSDNSASGKEPRAVCIECGLHDDIRRTTCLHCGGQMLEDKEDGD